MTNKGIELLKEFEGLRLKAYKPVATEKYFTIGYGHYGPDVTEGMEITKEEAEDLLRLDITTFENQVVKQLIPVTLPPEAIDALVSFTYNVGIGNFKKSTLLAKVNANPLDLDGIETEFSRWNRGGGQVLGGLVKRRREEYLMYEEAVLGQYSKKELLYMQPPQ